MLSRFDLFTVDPVSIQREKQKTKNAFGGFLVLLLCITTILSFVLLFLYNENKRDIQTVELLNSKNIITTSLPFQIEWEPGVLDVDPIELVTQSGKHTECYQSRNATRVNTSVELCPFGTDLYSEQNGVGFVFKYNKIFSHKKIVPFSPGDIGVYTVKDLYTYIVHPFRNEFCVYSLQDFTHNCIPYNYIDASTIYTNYYQQDYTYAYSIYDNVNTVYLLYNMSVVNTYSSTNTTLFVSDNRVVSYNVYISESEDSSFYKLTMSIIDIISDKLLYYIDTQGIYCSVYEHTVSYVSFLYQDPSSNYLEIDITSVNVFDLSSNLKNITYNSEYNNTEKNIYFNTVLFPFNKIKMSHLTNNLIFFIAEDIDSIRYVINFTYAIVVYTENYITIRNIIVDCSDQKGERIVTSLFPIQYGDTIIYFLYYSNTNEIYSIYLLSDDGYVHVKTFNFVKTTVDLYAINSINKIANDTFILYVNKPVVIDYTTGDSMSTGGILQCINSICQPLYTHSINLYTSKNFNPKVATVTYGNYQQILYLNDVLPQIDTKSNIIAPSFVYSYSTKDTTKELAMNKFQKRLYSVYTSSAKTINITMNPLVNYYIFDNSNTGYDNKFTCYQTNKDAIYIDNFLMDYITFEYNNPYYNNLKSCSIHDTLNIPFLFDSFYFIQYPDNKISFREQEDMVVGMFLLNIDDTVRKITVTTTKSSPLSVLGNIGGLLSTLITLFAFFKNTLWKYSHRTEIYELTHRTQKDNEVVIEMSTQEKE